MIINIKNVQIGGGTTPKILGILNISPESFYPDSYTPINQILNKATKMISDGVDIIDIGARSTALNSPTISISEERDRLIHALKELTELDNIVLSVDTIHPEVLNAALHYDINLINDINGLLDPEYTQIVADSGLPVIAMATHRIPGDSTNLIETHRSIQEVVDRANKYDINELIIDPGVGNWISNRSIEADWELCRHFNEFHQYGFPILAAISRKKFIGDIIGKPSNKRMYGTLGLLFYILEHGRVDMIRVHDISESKDIIQIFLKLYQNI